MHSHSMYSICEWESYRLHTEHLYHGAYVAMSIYTIADDTDGCTNQLTIAHGNDTRRCASYGCARFYACAHM